jgi:hypothetical protein
LISLLYGITHWLFHGLKGLEEIISPWSLDIGLSWNIFKSWIIYLYILFLLLRRVLYFNLRLSILYIVNYLLRLLNVLNLLLHGTLLSINLLVVLHLGNLLNNKLRLLFSRTLWSTNKLIINTYLVLYLLCIDSLLLINSNILKHFTSRRPLSHNLIHRSLIFLLLLTTLNL